MGLSPDDAKKKLKLISVRRNAIVHEADMHPLTNIKGPISRAECNDVTDFLLSCGNAIGKLVIWLILLAPHPPLLPPDPKTSIDSALPMPRPLAAPLVRPRPRRGTAPSPAKPHRHDTASDRTPLARMLPRVVARSRQPSWPLSAKATAIAAWFLKALTDPATQPTAIKPVLFALRCWRS
jgi:hypothetical protein